MIELYLENRLTSSFQGDSIKEVLKDYIEWSVENDFNKNINKIEQRNDNDVIIQVILGKEIQNDLDLQIKNARQEIFENENHLVEMSNFLNSQI